MQHLIREKALKLANSKVVKGFYPTLIAMQTKTTIQETEEVLEQLVAEGEIKRKHQLLCHNDNCLRQLDMVNNIEDLKSEYSCDFCGEEMEEVLPEYIRHFYTGKDK
ncbi:hypothetical protein PP175_26055 (plasmid) [Aneurinibacillus sp. Ricciae_BoGa-3]|uniref:hypothetical protein n=1 Tax=Aneurinibacillus sp. Ricciae_BoGa-3 TaxID=3022697 RepID=UPI00234005A8|nr:hypothetical protein [Aneurinibacillus sp. Ricciae_BoGa-3]WCK57531.1 hypothetical protein PP175_26055 [Aneurinibacillus sp. Ricciae_BoGa-3]